MLWIGMRESDADYFARRAAEEEQRADSADGQEAAEIHSKLARKYAAMAAEERVRASVPQHNIYPNQIHSH